MDKPFIEENVSNYFLRTFLADTPEEELKWHWDEEDRIISPVGETDWKFQLDNSLPQLIDSQIFIPKGEFHRIIKGSGDLTIKVVKIF